MVCSRFYFAGGVGMKFSVVESLYRFADSVFPWCAFSKEGYTHVFVHQGLSVGVASPLSVENKAPRYSIWTLDGDGRKPTINGMF